MPIQLFPFRPQDPRPAERGQEDGQLQGDDRRGRRAQPTRDDRGRRLAHGPRRGARIFPRRLRDGGHSLLVEKAGQKKGPSRSILSLAKYNLHRAKKKLQTDVKRNFVDRCFVDFVNGAL